MRYGSDYARAWARRLRFGDVRAKSILMSICNYVDEMGAAWPSIPTLAEDTDQSDDTVRRRLKDLEEYGVIVRLPRWVDDNGKVNTDGRGRRTSDELRLMFEADQSTIDVAIVRRGGPSDADADPRQQQGSAENLTLASSRGQTPAGSKGDGRTAATGSKLEPSGEVIPPSPPSGGFSTEPDGWVEFETAFTADGVPIMRQSLAKQLFAALAVDEKPVLTKAACGYLAWRRSERKPPAKASAQTFIRERDSWPKWSALAPAPRAAPVPTAFVGEDEPFFAALSVLNVIMTGEPRVAEQVDGQRRGLLTRIQPTPDLLALAEFDGDPSAWLEFETDDPIHRNVIGAWRQRVQAWTGRDLELQRIEARDDAGNTLFRSIEGLGGKIYEMPIIRIVLRVPCAWPPRKDGTLIRQGGADPPLTSIEEIDRVIG